MQHPVVYPWVPAQGVIPRTPLEHGPPDDFAQFASQSHVQFLTTLRPVVDPIEIPLQSSGQVRRRWRLWLRIIASPRSITSETIGLSRSYATSIFYYLRPHVEGPVHVRRQTIHAVTGVSPKLKESRIPLAFLRAEFLLESVIYVGRED